MRATVIRRRFAASERELLRLMVKNSGWSEIGGRAIREQSDFCTGGDVIGRTQWIGKPEWAKASSGANMTQDEISRAVELAIAGKPLGRKQRILIEAMLDEMEDFCSPAEQ